MVYEKGVLPGSEKFFLNPGGFSRKMGLSIVRAGNYTCDGRYRIMRDNFDCYLLIYTRAGSGVIATAEDSFIVQEGDFVLLDCHRSHSYGTYENNWNFNWIHLEGGTADQLYKAASSLRQNLVFHASQDYAVRHTMDRLVSLLRQAKKHPEGWDVQINGYMLEIFGRLISESAAQDAADGSQDPISHALEYIHRNLDKNIQIADLAAQVNYSPHHFIRKFTGEVGATPYEYIKSLRIDMSKLYLRTSDMSVSEIGRMCGFARGSSFSTAFRLVAGETPTAYREKFLQDAFEE